MKLNEPIRHRKSHTEFKWNPFVLRGEAPASIRGMPPIIAAAQALWASVLIPTGTSLAVTDVAAGVTYGIATGITVGNVISASVILGSLAYTLIGQATQNTKNASSMRTGTSINVGVHYEFYRCPSTP